MKSSRCTGCNSKLGPETRICERCGRPTPLATSEDLIAWEVRQWREHRSEPAVQAKSAPAGESRSVVQVLNRPAARPDVPRIVRKVIRKRPESRDESRSRLRSFRGRIRRAEPEAAPETEDDIFHLRACPRCERDDWLVRLRHDQEFDRWTYLCLRCVKDFASELRLPHSRKPFIAAGAIIAFLLILPTLL